jgi:hypothetical protein
VTEIGPILAFVSHFLRRKIQNAYFSDRLLGRPTGSIGKSKLDSKVPDIVDLLRDKASYSFMARRFQVSRPTIMNFIKTRKLKPN